MRLRRPFSSPAQESRFRVFFALKRWPLDIACALFPLTILWLIQSSRYFTFRGCSCSLDAPEPCEQFRSQAAWLATFPCAAPEGTSGPSLLVLLRWYWRNWYHVQFDFLWTEFADIGFILVLHACAAVLALAGKRFWSFGQTRRHVLVALRVGQKAVNLVAVFTVRPAHKPSFMDVHFGPSTVYGATVLAWYTVLTAVSLTDSAWLVPLEWASLAAIIFVRNSALLSPWFVLEVLGKQLLIGVLLPVVLMYAYERIQRSEFLRLEAAKLDPVATIFQGKSVSLAPPSCVVLPPAGDLPSTDAFTSTSCSAAVTDVPPCPAAAAGGSAASAGGRPVTASSCPGSPSHPAGHCDPPAQASTLQGLACGPPCTPPVQQTCTEVQAALLRRATPSGANTAATATPQARKPRGMYMRRTKVQLVSVKIINPPPELYADPSPLLTAVNTALASSLTNPELIATRHTTIRGCLHLLLWLQDATTSAGARLPAAQHSDPSPASQPSCPAEHKHIADNILAAVQLGIPNGIDPALSVTVTAYGHTAHSGTQPTNAAAPQLTAAATSDQGLCSTCLPTSPCAAAAAATAAAVERGAAAAGCWLAGGRATWGCDGEDAAADDDIVVCVLPGSSQEAALVAAGSAARAVVVEMGSGAVLLDLVIAALQSPAGSDAAADAAHLCIRVPLAGMAPPSCPVASAVHLLLLPHGDRSGHVLCNFPLLLAPPTVAQELRSYHCDAAEQFLDTLVADASAASPAAPTPGAPPAAAVPLPCLQLRAECQAFNEIIMGLVWDMLAFSAPGPPLHAPPASAAATAAAAAAAPDPSVHPPKELATTEDIDSIVSFLHQQGMPATARFFAHASAHPAPQQCATAPLVPRPPSTGAAHTSSLLPGKPASLCTPHPPEPAEELSSCLSCTKAATGGVGTASKLCWALSVVDAAIGTLQLAAVVVRHARQHNSHHPTLLYYVVVLALYAALLGPLWNYWRQRHLVMLPLLLRMAAAAPYIAGWVPLPNSTSTAQRLLLLVLMNGTMCAFYARCIPRHKSGGSEPVKQHPQQRDAPRASSAAASTCSLAATTPCHGAGTTAEDLPMPGRPEVAPSTSSSTD